MTRLKVTAADISRKTQPAPKLTVSLKRSYRLNSNSKMRGKKKKITQTLPSDCGKKGKEAKGKTAEGEKWGENEVVIDKRRR